MFFLYQSVAGCSVGSWNAASLSNGCHGTIHPCLSGGARFAL